MNLIKLDAIDSTNDYLKQLSNNLDLKNFTVVVAKNQTKGKGQMGAEWNSEIGKNLTFSILINTILHQFDEIFDLNVAVANSIIQVLDTLEVPKLSIKWPNDILSGTTKIAGILIENSFKHDKTIASIVGIGLNVNQTNFEKLTKASSLSVIMNQEYDLELVLKKIVIQIEKNCDIIKEKKSQLLWDYYHNRLFRKDIKMSFKTINDENFTGIIKGVSRNGQLQVLVSDNNLKRFSVKEIQLLY